MSIDNHRMTCGNRAKNPSQTINSPFTGLDNLHELVHNDRELVIVIPHGNHELAILVLYVRCQNKGQIHKSKS